MKKLLELTGKKPSDIRIAICGQVKGLPEEAAKEKFEKARRFYQDKGFKTITPFSEITDRFGYKNVSEKVIGAMYIDAIANSDAAAFLPNYIYSAGAEIENDFCVRYNIPRLFAGTFDFITPMNPNHHV